MYGDFEDKVMGCMMFLMGVMAASIVGGIIVVFIDEVYFDRVAFVAKTECATKRMESTRKFLTSTVVCIPAYRGTKSDTLTVQGIK